jgi:hypothetical protein
MVMFKHGVAYVERGGPASGDFELSFKKDEMNDVLKSLNVWVARGDATVGALGFDKPEDPLEALAERSLDLPLGSTMYNLLGALRGRAVAIESGGTRYEGEIVGLDRSSAGENGDRTRVSLRAADGSIVFVDLDSAQSIELRDDTAQADLAFVLDRTRAAAAGRARFVRVGLSGHAEDLRISYVIPAPAWRVSYRLARDGDTGAATLHAWGIVHNPADEDLDDLELTLTTGQPVSFVIDLYTPKNVRRVVVEESSRVAAAPTSFERAPMPPPAPMMAPSPMIAAAAAPSPFAPPSPSPPPPPSPSRPIEPPAAYADRGELFEYRVGPRVSLRRGGSAMVPLLSARLEAKRERIWRAGAAPSPDLVLTFSNGSGAVLEEGPVVLYDEDVYAGEAMVPYSARGAEVKLAFAKDLGVRCKRTAETRRVVNGVRLGPDALFEEHRREEHHTIQVENDHPEEAMVIVELPKVAGHSFDPGFAQPFEETASFQRFRVTAPPHARAVVTVVERWHDSTRIEYAQVTTENLDRWMNERFLDPAWFRAFADIRTEWYAAQEAQGRAKVARKELEDAYAKQAKLAAQLEVLKEGGPEGQLRLRYVQELATEQDRVNACEAEAKRREAESRAASERGRAKLGALVGVRR